MIIDKKDFQKWLDKLDKDEIEVRITSYDFTLHREVYHYYLEDDIIHLLVSDRLRDEREQPELDL